MKRSSNLIVLLAVICVSVSARAAIVYEGFYRISQGTKAAAYGIDRLEKIDSNSNHKVTRYTATATGEAQTHTFEVDSGFRAVNYSMTTTKAGAVADQVQASFSGGWVTITATVPGKGKETTRLQVPSDTTFDVFIGHYLKTLKQGQLVSGTKLNVVRFIDEPGISVSEVTVGPVSTIGGWKTYQIDVRPRDKESDRTFFVTDEGQLIQFRGAGFAAVLVSSLKEAAGPIAINTAEIQKVFGGMPKGGHMKPQAPAKSAAAPAKPIKK